MPKKNQKSSPTVRMAGEYQPLFHEIGFTPEMVFNDPAVKCWRKLPDRENCTWDLPRPDGTVLRMHVKRYPADKNSVDPADEEATAYRSLELVNIPTAKLMAWGKIADGRSFILIKDLEGFEAADKLIEAGTPFDKLLEPTAELAADLHNAGYHHRDLYLCHFFVKLQGSQPQARLIDIARVKPLPTILIRQRWIVKDLAQFWYSTFSLAVSNAQRDDWLGHYAQRRKLSNIVSLRRGIARKARSIAAHDANLNVKQPGRNISIPRD